MLVYMYVYFNEMDLLIRTSTVELENSHKAPKKMKRIAMVQWVNCLRNNIFVNLPPLSLSCEISGALHLAQLGLMAGWQADR